MSLYLESCRPCRKGEPVLSETEINELHPLIPAWELDKANTRLTREFRFKNFAEALKFVNQVGKLAEKNNHHPDIEFGWGYVRFRLHTHATDRLHRNDFILAAKIDHAGKLG
jgi:4a-hydroxytetrahydrobiopterin dehydratase